MLVGLQIGPVYRLQVTDIPNNPGVEIFPTVEVIDRLYPPPGLALRFPIPIELTQDELELAARGMFVTRVIYVEDPSIALPIRQTKDGEQPWIEAPPGEDPLVAADGLGRPVAILRIGGRVPNEAAPTRPAATSCRRSHFRPERSVPESMPAARRRTTRGVATSNGAARTQTIARGATGSAGNDRAIGSRRLADDHRRRLIELRLEAGRRANADGRAGLDQPDR